MSSDTKPTKPMPSPAEINAYLELSAARTRMRLPLAKGAAAVIEPKGAAPAPAAALPSSAVPRAAGSRALPLQGSKKPAPAEAAPHATPGEPGAWSPFASDDES
jgi:hypothetical protein